MIFFSSLDLFAESHYNTAIALNGSGIPAGDLVYEARPLTPEEAWQKRNDLDLSLLDPLPNEIWSRGEHLEFSAIEQELKSLDKSGETVQFSSVIQSHSGLLRFNVEHSGHQQGHLTIHMDKTLHTLLLRREFLDQLGYHLPPLRYLEDVWVNFESSDELENFLSNSIPQQTLGSASRWVVEREHNRVLLQDVAIGLPSEWDHYNVALGVPPRYLSSRTLRALLLVYALLDLDESVNKFNWHVGQVRNQKIYLPHFVPAQFATTKDDALWILNEMKRFSRDDIVGIVKKAKFPPEVELLVTEKVLSRFNYLFQLFNLDYSILPVNTSPSLGKNLLDGKLTRESWPGYASRFSHGVADSPFDSLTYSFLSESQSQVLSNLTSRVNQELSAFSLADAQGKLLGRQFQEGLEHFVRTGELMTHGLGMWVSPVLNGQLIASRDVVIGPYLGTDNLIQQADTFGYGIRIGAHVGLDSFALNYGASFSGTLNYVKTYSHLRPVRTLKESLEEPYRNIVVSHTVSKLERAFSLLEENPEESTEVMEEIGETLNSLLKVGESLIITERLSPQLDISGLMTFGQAQLRASHGRGHLLIKRIHLHRSGVNSIQVYVDNGRAKDLSLSYRMDSVVPILEMSVSQRDGEYDVKAYQVDVSLEDSANSDVGTNFAALQLLLESGSTELLDEGQTPFVVNNQFIDRSSRFRLFHWRYRSLMQSGRYEVTSPNGFKNHFMRVTQHSQSGVNYQSFLTDLANFYINQYFQGINIQSSVWQNPAQTYLGNSNNRSGRFEAMLEETRGLFEIQEAFMNIQYTHEGWRSTRDNIIREMLSYNRKIGRQIFSDHFIRDVASMRFYQVELNINIYQQGFENLKALSPSDIEKIERRYSRQNAFDPKCRQVRYRNTLECGNFRILREKNSTCQNLKTRPSQKREFSECLLSLTMLLEKILDFDDFVSLVGQENIFVHGILNGFRTESEVLLSPIRSHTFGRVRSAFWNGPLEHMRDLSGIQFGEFSGSWMREGL